MFPSLHSEETSDPKIHLSAEFLLKIHSRASTLPGAVNVSSQLEMIKSRSCLESFRIN